MHLATRRRLLAVAAGGVFAPFVSRIAVARDLDQLVGPLLMLGFAGSTKDAPDAPFIARELSKGAIGGVCFLGHNVKSKGGVESLTALYRAAPRKRPALIAVDQEGGAVQRLSTRTGYRDTPGAQLVAKSQTPEAAADTYEAMARMVRGAGFNLNLAPVVDLGFEKKNPIIAKYGRAYGNDGAGVARYAAAFCKGHRKAGLLATLKHFPGHGSTLLDSHKAPVDLTPTWREDELEPYRQLAAAGLGDVVMSGHLAHERMGGRTLAATLSRVAVEDILRRQCGWKGVVMTDDVDMRAIRATYEPAEAAVAAFAAGNDLILMSNTAEPDDELPRRVLAHVSDALSAGRLTLSRLESAFARVDALAGKAS